MHDRRNVSSGLFRFAIQTKNQGVLGDGDGESCGGGGGGGTRTRETGTPRAPVMDATAEPSNRTMLHDIGLTNKSSPAVTSANNSADSQESVDCNMKEVDTTTAGPRGVAARVVYIYHCHVQYLYFSFDLIINTKYRGCGGAGSE